MSDESFTGHCPTCGQVYHEASLVEQIEAIVVEWEDELDSLNAMSRIQELLRAAREAGGQ